MRNITCESGKLLLIIKQQRIKKTNNQNEAIGCIYYIVWDHLYDLIYKFYNIQPKAFTVGGRTDRKETVIRI